MPYSWSLAGGSLPAGLSLGSWGTIEGWPFFAPAGGYPIVVRVTDATGATAQVGLTMGVAAPPAPPPAVPATSLPRSPPAGPSSPPAPTTWGRPQRPVARCPAPGP
ncbi:MAG: Ig domain-containing protein [Actinomycetota bacterium]|nr:Ig domain-containing protein [Actinomycetota bacterium]